MDGTPQVDLCCERAQAVHDAWAHDLDTLCRMQPMADAMWCPTGSGACAAHASTSLRLTQRS